MKKFVALIAFALFAVSVSAQVHGFVTTEERNELNTMRDHSRRIVSTVVTYSDTAEEMIILPDSSVIWDIDVRVAVNFNDSGADSLAVGTKSDPDFFLEVPVHTGAGSFDSITFSTELPYLLTTQDTIYTVVTGENADDTAGKAGVYVTYSRK